MTRIEKLKCLHSDIENAIYELQVASGQVRLAMRDQLSNRQIATCLRGASDWGVTAAGRIGLIGNRIFKIKSEVERRTK